MSVSVNPSERADARSVSLVLALDYGDAIGTLGERMPVWIVESTVNLAALERLRTRDDFKIMQLTSFPLREGESIPEACARIVVSLDDHHDRSSSKTPYQRLFVIGVPLESVSRESFFECGFDGFIGTPEGFIATKSSA